MNRTEFSRLTINNVCLINKVIGSIDGVTFSYMGVMYKLSRCGYVYKLTAGDAVVAVSDIVPGELDVHFDGITVRGLLGLLKYLNLADVKVSGLTIDTDASYFDSAFKLYMVEMEEVSQFACEIYNKFREKLLTLSEVLPEKVYFEHKLDGAFDYKYRGVRYRAAFRMNNFDLSEDTKEVYKRVAESVNSDTQHLDDSVVIYWLDDDYKEIKYSVPLKIVSLLPGMKWENILTHHSDDFNVVANICGLVPGIDLTPVRDAEDEVLALKNAMLRMRELKVKLHRDFSRYIIGLNRGYIRQLDV